MTSKQKLTWMVDTLIEGKPSAKPEETVPEKSLRAKTDSRPEEFLLGGEPKKSTSKQIGKPTEDLLTGH